MTEHPLADALEGEHHDIDRRLQEFEAAPSAPTAAGVHAAAALLRRHIWVEEEVLFPALREQGLLAPVLVMLREHGQIWRTLDELEQQLAADPAAPAAVATCHRLLAELLHHNVKEERILYPVADAAVPDPAVAVAPAGPPEGWTPERASA